MIAVIKTVEPKRWLSINFCQDKTWNTKDGKESDK